MRTIVYVLRKAEALLADKRLGEDGGRTQEMFGYFSVWGCSASSDCGFSWSIHRRNDFRVATSIFRQVRYSQLHIMSLTRLADIWILWSLPFLGPGCRFSKESFSRNHRNIFDLLFLQYAGSMKWRNFHLRRELKLLMQCLPREEGIWRSRRET